MLLNEIFATNPQYSVTYNAKRFKPFIAGNLNKSTFYYPKLYYIVKCKSDGYNLLLNVVTSLKTLKIYE